MTPRLPNPFITDQTERFELDEAAFIEAIEPEPLFLRDPSPEYLAAREQSLSQQENANV